MSPSKSMESAGGQEGIGAVVGSAGSVDADMTVDGPCGAVGADVGGAAKSSG